ncbi:protein kinase-like domain, concanavalin A-like lectin/glucanase domain protein [Tanacetum coccineum]
MENANPSCSTSNREFLDPKKKKEIESWLKDSRIVDSLDGEIMNKRLEPRQKPSNPSKSNNFLGKVRGLKVFIGKFTYKCNLMILEDTTSVIDHHLGEVVFGKQFTRKTGLVYDLEEGTVTFKKDNEKITFKIPHKMEAFNHMDSKGVNTDSIPPFVLEKNYDRRKTYYSNSLTLGPEYKEDESISKEILYLMKLEREAKRHKGEVTLYLMRRSLKVLRKFHSMILGGRFNHLSHYIEVTTIFTDSNQFHNGINVLGNELTKKRCRLSGKAPLPVDRKLTREIIKDRLTKVMSMESRVILVHTYFNTGLIIFEIAKSLGMIKRGYVWIATAWLSAVLDSIGIPHKNTGTLHGANSFLTDDDDEDDSDDDFSNDEDLHSPMDEVDPFIFFMDTAKVTMKDYRSVLDWIQRLANIIPQENRISLDALYKSIGKQYTWSSAVKAPGTQKSKQDRISHYTLCRADIEQFVLLMLANLRIVPETIFLSETTKRLPRAQPTQNPVGMVLVDRPAEGARAASCCS